MILQEIAKYLAAQGHGAFDETGVTGNIFINALPPSPDECICLYSNSGLPADVRNEYRTPAIQVYVRSVAGDGRNAITLLQNIINSLNGFNSDTFDTGGLYIIDCYAQQSAPTHIGQDSNNRYEFTANFLIEYKM